MKVSLGSEETVAEKREGFTSPREAVFISHGCCTKYHKLGGS